MRKLFERLLLVLFAFIFSIGIAKADVLYTYNSSINSNKVVQVGDTLNYSLSLSGNVGAIMYDSNLLGLESKDAVWIGSLDKEGIGYPLDVDSYEIYFSNDGVIYFYCDDYEDSNIQVSFKVISAPSVESSSMTSINHVLNNVYGMGWYNPKTSLNEIRDDAALEQPDMYYDEFYIADKNGNVKFSSEPHYYEVSEDLFKQICSNLDELTNNGNLSAVKKLSEYSADDFNVEIKDNSIDEIVNDDNSCKCVADKNIFNDPIFIGVSCGAAFFFILSIILIVKCSKNKKAN